MRRKAGFMRGDNIEMEAGASRSNWLAKETSSTPATSSSLASASHSGEDERHANVSNTVSSICSTKRIINF